MQSLHRRSLLRNHAWLKLDEDLPWDIPMSTPIRGQANNGEWVTVTTTGEEMAGSSLLEVIHEEKEAICSVGGLPDDMILKTAALFRLAFSGLETTKN